MLPWTISHEKKSCNRLVDWSICLRPAEPFSVANSIKCHIKVILAIFVVKSNQKAKIKSKIQKAKILFVNVPPGLSFFQGL